MTNVSGGLAGVQWTLSALSSTPTSVPAAESAAPGESFATTLAQASGEFDAPYGPASSGLFIDYIGPTPAAAPGGGQGAPPDLAGLLASSGTGSIPASATPVAAAHLSTISSVVSGAGQSVVREALKFQGTPYVWGGTSPNGFDCSGFVQYVYARLGVNLPRTSEEQAGVGTAVSALSAAQPGDLLFFAGSDGTASAPGHVAIYLGRGEMIDAPYTGSSVRVESVATAGSIVAIRRVVGA